MKIENTSGLFPLGAAVLLLPYEPDLHSKRTMIVVPESYRQRLRVVENRGIVIAIGPEAWRGEMQPRAKVGDKILFSKHAGAASPGIDGKLYRVVNADDIFLGIEDGIDLAEYLGLPQEDKQMSFDFEEAQQKGFGLAETRTEGQAYYSKYANHWPGEKDK